MKACKNCKEEIAQDASKCPKCQSFQAWYGSPWFGLLFPFLLMIPLLYFTMSSFSRPKIEFETYKNEVALRQLSQDTVMIKEEPKINILVEIDNQTEIKWKRPSYEIVYLSESGELLNVEQGSSFGLIVPSKAKVKASIKTRLFDEYQGAKIDVRLVDLSHDRY